jgi:Na+-transporting methylmalonyl-CoA/oxaloacetate decarboxylase gamma subunit
LDRLSRSIAMHHDRIHGVVVVVLLLLLLTALVWWCGKAREEKKKRRQRAKHLLVVHASASSASASSATWRHMSAHVLLVGTHQPHALLHIARGLIESLGNFF